MDQQMAARSVLLEVLNVLGAFKQEIVVVGGWVPDLWYPGKHHMGSLDIDLAIRPSAVATDAYSTILGRLKATAYTHSINPTRFYRTVAGASEPVKVDLITGEYVTGDKSHDVQVDEIRLSCLRGIDLALEVYEEVIIEGTMPDGARNTVRAMVVRPEAFLLIKSFALAERTKPKDAYDIAFVLANFEPSIEELAQRLAPLVTEGLGAEAYQILREKFHTLNSVGPVWAAEVASESGADRGQAQQAAFQDALHLIESVTNSR